MPEAMYCINHPDRETLIRCNKCNRPICPDCAIRHPVGLRCRECAQLRRLPPYDVSLSHHLLGFLAGLAASTVAGIVIAAFLPYILSWLAGPVAGVFVSQAMDWATGHKRGLGLAILCGLAVVLGYLLGASVPLVLANPHPSTLAAWLNPYHWNIVYLLLAVLFASGRLR
jgi:hypothetical protein